MQRLGHRAASSIPESVVIPTVTTGLVDKAPLFELPQIPTLQKLGNGQRFKESPLEVGGRMLGVFSFLLL